MRTRSLLPLVAILTISCSSPAVVAPNPTVEALATQIAGLQATATAAPLAAPIATTIVPPTPSAAPTATAVPAAVAQPATATPTLEEAVALAKRYTVLVRADLGDGAVGFGSGISLGGGRVLTNLHVVEDAV